MEELLPIPKITTFVPHSTIDNESCGRASKPMLYPIYSYLPGSGSCLFLVNFTAPNK